MIAQIKFFYTKNNQQYWAVMNLKQPKYHQEYNFYIGDRRMPFALGTYADSLDVRFSRRTGRVYIGYDEADEILLGELSQTYFDLFIELIENPMVNQSIVQPDEWKKRYAIEKTTNNQSTNNI